MAMSYVDTVAADLPGEEIYSQGEAESFRDRMNIADPGPKAMSNKDRAHQTRTDNVLAKALIYQLNCNSDSTNEFFHSLTDKMAGAWQEFLCYDQVGKAALHSLPTGTSLATGVVLPLLDGLVPEFDGAYWKMKLPTGSPHKPTRLLYPTLPDGSYSPHPVASQTCSNDPYLEIAKTLFTQRNKDTPEGAASCTNIYFSRKDRSSTGSEVTAGCAVAVVKEETVVQHLHRIEKSDDAVYASLTYAAAAAMVVVFCIPLKEKLTMQLSLHQAGEQTMGDILSNSDIIAPVQIQIREVPLHNKPRGSCFTQERRALTPEAFEDGDTMTTP
jgi:hypothetical protein